jgi:hypothetical protein
VNLFRTAQAMPPTQTIDPVPTLDSAPAVEGAGALPRGIFEPPDGFVLAAIAHNKRIVALCAVALALAGIAFGLLRTSTYEASATLQVGQVNPNSPGFYGYTQSASSLATAFSRSIAAGPVLAAVEDKLGLSRAQATPRLASEPIPLSPAFRVIATGPTESDAIRLANTAAAAVIVYEGKSNSTNPQARSLLDNYRDVSLTLRQAEAKITQLEESPGSAADLLRAEADKGVAQVKRRAITNAYVAAVESQAPSLGLVSLVAGATSTSNDRLPKIELFAFIGLLAGIVLGCAVAVLRERRQRGHTSLA